MAADMRGATCAEQHARSNMRGHKNIKGSDRSEISVHYFLCDIGESFLTRAVELVKSGHNFVFVLDNIDWQEKVHDMRKENQNKSVHAMATSIVFSRVSLPQSLPNTHPQQDLRKCNVRQVVNLFSAEIDTIRMRYRVIVQNHLLQQFTAFESFKPSSPLTTYCQYAENMSEKSETVTMPAF